MHAPGSAKAVDVADNVADGHEDDGKGAQSNVHTKEARQLVLCGGGRGPMGQPNRQRYLDQLGDQIEAGQQHDRNRTSHHSKVVKKDFLPNLPRCTCLLLVLLAVRLGALSRELSNEVRLRRRQLHLFAVACGVCTGGSGQVDDRQWVAATHAPVAVFSSILIVLLPVSMSFQQGLQGRAALSHVRPCPKSVDVPIFQHHHPVAVFCKFQSIRSDKSRLPSQGSVHCFDMDLAGHVSIEGAVWIV
mmetsp:Transcript_20286/g.43294  ORF Transcript_20286/g.43294 Transcript_20286/m.43294 type:complete len:245 (+) Transcript_20286:1785-2519(+)